MKFQSTRGLEAGIKSAEAIIRGIAKDGGLYVPESFPNLYDSLKKEKSLSYEELAFKIIKEFFSDINEEEVKKLMNALTTDGVYEVSDKVKEFVNEFYGNFATEEEVAETIKNVYQNKNYLMDTHTAVAETVYEKYVKDSKDNRKVLIASTASPYKFPRSICSALDIDVDKINDFEVIDKLCEVTKVQVPVNLKGLDKKPVLHDEVWDKDEMEEALLSYLK